MCKTILHHFIWDLLILRFWYMQEANAPWIQRDILLCFLSSLSIFLKIISLTLSCNICIYSVTFPIWYGRMVSKYSILMCLWALTVWWWIKNMDIYKIFEMITLLSKLSAQSVFFCENIKRKIKLHKIDKSWRSKSVDEDLDMKRRWKFPNRPVVRLQEERNRCVKH